MDTTVSGISAVVVAELRAAGYMESTVGQYAKTIKALTPADGSIHPSHANLATCNECLSLAID